MGGIIVCVEATTVPLSGNLHTVAAALPLQPETATPRLRHALHRPQRRLIHPRDGRHQEVPRHQPERQGPLLDCSSPYVIETLGVLSSRRTLRYLYKILTSMLTLFANICACHWHYHYPSIWYVYMATWWARDISIENSSSTCDGINNFHSVPLLVTALFWTGDEIGKYCLLLSVFSSIFCNDVECSSYIYLYIYYITYYVYQKDKRKHDVDNKIQSNRWWLLVTTVSNHWCFSHTENWKIKALPKHRNKIFLLGSSEFLVFIYVSCITQVP